MYGIMMAPQRPTLFGWALRTRREQLGLSQNALSKLAGVERGYISSLESGRRGNPSQDVIDKLARALETTPADLLELAGSLKGEARDQVTITVEREKAGPLKRIERFPLPTLALIEELVDRLIYERLSPAAAESPTPSPPSQGRPPGPRRSTEQRPAI